jgi:outer membrane protein OmpU
MNKLKKIGLSALAGSLVAVSAAQAGEMSVGGSAWIGIGNTDEGIGNGFTSMTDSLNFTGTGELDNGMTVTLFYEIDGDASSESDTSAGAGNFDTHYVKLSGDFGAVTYSGHGVDGVLAGMDDKTPNAYEEAWDAGTSVADNTLVGRSHNDSLRYDSPSFNGITVHAYHSEQADSGAGAYQDFGITIQPEMVEGLELGFASGEFDTSDVKSIDQDTMYIKYAYGPITVGYQQSESTTSNTDVGVTEAFESDALGITFAVNDNLSIGYGVFEADYEDTTKVDQESTAITASYTMGSITIGGLIGEDANIAGVAANDNDKYEASISFAF